MYILQLEYTVFYRRVVSMRFKQTCNNLVGKQKSWNISFKSTFLKITWIFTLYPRYIGANRACGRGGYYHVNNCQAPLEHRLVFPHDANFILCDIILSLHHGLGWIYVILVEISWKNFNIDDIVNVFTQTHRRIILKLKYNEFFFINILGGLETPKKQGDLSILPVLTFTNLPQVY